VMGELLDRLNAMDARLRAPGEPIDPSDRPPTRSRGPFDRPANASTRGSRLFRSWGCRWTNSAVGRDRRRCRRWRLRSWSAC
jgi:hypothetical protein